MVFALMCFVKNVFFNKEQKLAKRKKEMMQKLEDERKVFEDCL